MPQAGVSRCRNTVVAKFCALRADPEGCNVSSTASLAETTGKIVWNLEVRLLHPSATEAKDVSRPKLYTFLFLQRPPVYTQAAATVAMTASRQQ